MKDRKYVLMNTGRAGWTYLRRRRLPVKVHSVVTA